MDSISKAGDRAVTSTLKMQEGRIKLELKAQSARVAFEEWQSRVSTLLEDYEKKARKTRKNQNTLEWAP